MMALGRDAADDFFEVILSEDIAAIFASATGDRTMTRGAVSVR